jgi:hypothetical protein
MRQRAEGHRVACPGEVLPLGVAAAGRLGNHVVSALVDAHVVDVAVRVAVDVEEHQVAAPCLGLADGPELEELVFRGALNGLAEVAVDVLGEARAVEPGRAGPPVEIGNSLVRLSATVARAAFASQLRRTLGASTHGHDPDIGI